MISRNIYGISFLGIIGFILLLALSGCGTGSEETAAGSALLRMAVSEAAPKAQADMNVQGMLETGRKKVISASVGFEVKDLNNAEESILKLVSDYEGWIDNSSYQESSLYLTVRIPTERLEEFLADSSELGKVTSKSIHADDVTDYYTDTEARLETLMVLKERYTEYLRKAESMEDIITIERELSNTITEIEQLERTMRRLTTQIDYATVNLTLKLPADKQVSGNLPNLLEGLKQLGYGFINLLYYIAIGLLYAIIFGIPVIFVLGLLYFVGFGRLGLIRRFFKALSRDKKESEGTVHGKG